MLGDLGRCGKWVGGGVFIPEVRRRAGGLVGDGAGSRSDQARCIPETLGKSKTAFPSHHHADLVLHVETPWAGLATSLSPHQRHQLILEVRWQGAGSEQESPLPRRDLRAAEKLQQAFK